jgi:hypothetical protein
MKNSEPREIVKRNENNNEIRKAAKQNTKSSSETKGITKRWGKVGPIS